MLYQLSYASPDSHITATHGPEDTRLRSQNDGYRLKLSHEKAARQGAISDP
jgi:hypothetical protein